MIAKHTEKFNCTVSTINSINLHNCKLTQCAVTAKVRVTAWYIKSIHINSHNMSTYTAFTIKTQIYA